MISSLLKRIFAPLAVLLAVLTARAEAPVVYVLPVHDEIDTEMWLRTRRACQEAREAGASLMVVHLNTYGGAVDAADSIRTALMRLPIPTVAFVDNNAASAGALIALACDSVYMAPGATMGASTVVNGQGEPMPEKYQSYMKSIMRATAQHHGKVKAEGDTALRWRRDPSIAEQMVMPDRAISFTATEAIEAGYAEGRATSVENLLRDNFYPDYQEQRFESNMSEGVLGFLTNPAVRAILIMLIVGGIWLEMHSPGVGFPSAVALVAAAMYFLPMFITGTMAGWVVIVFIAGLILLALEIFVIPGFGVCGIAGIAAILASIVGAMLNSGGIAAPYSGDIAYAITVTLVGVVMAVGLVWYLTSKWGPKWFRRVSELQTAQFVSEGYIGVDTSVARFVGCEATAATDLRPAGKIRVEGHDGTLDAVSTGPYIDAGRKVSIVKFENAQLYVEPADEALS